MRRGELRWRRAARVPAVLAMSAGLALTGLSGASAASVEDTGWWWRPNSAVLPVELPKRADVGADQLLVELEPEGATAVAATRFRLAEGETSPVLTITPTSDSVIPEGAVVLACRVTSKWVTARGGKWEARPASDCLTSVKGIRGQDGKYVFALAPLQSDATIDVAFVPAAGPSYSLKFLAPTAVDLKTTMDSSSGSAGTGGDFASPDPTSFGADSEPSNGPGSASGSFDSGNSSGGGFTSGDSASSADFGSSPAFSQPSTFAPPTAVAPSVAAPSGVAPVAAVPGGVGEFPGAPASSDEDTKKGRTLGVIVLLAGAALSFWAYTGSRIGVTASPVVAQPGAVPVMGGLGRFEKVRTGPPPTLG